MMRSLPVLIALAALGCGPKEPARDPSQPGETAKAPLVMKMRAVRVDGSGELPFQINDPLKNGQRIAYYVTSDQDAYVYVMQFFADGSPPSVLFPDQGEQRIAGGRETRVPLAGQYLELEGEPGMENVYVVATRQPLDASAPELAKLVHDVRVSPGKNDPAPPPAPEPQTAPSPSPSPSLEPTAAPPSAQAIVDKPKPAPVKAIALPRPPPPNNYTALLQTRSIDLTPCPAEAGLTCRSLKLVKGSSYEGVADENGVVVIHFAFQHVR